MIASMPSRARTLASKVKNRLAASPHGTVSDDMGEEFRALHADVQALTMTSAERLFGLHQAIRYLHAAEIPGDVVECGVWRGGSSMMAALTLMALDVTRPLWLYDTFEGMTAPSEHDKPFQGTPDAAEAEYRRSLEWADASLQDVQANMANTGYPTELVRYVRGDIAQTLPAEMPDSVALLRLDTDWYASTRHELEHLWPRLSPGGVLIIDDYGHWEGARKAVDEFFADTPVLLARLDYTGRMVVKR